MKITPMMQQYLSTKEKYPDAILFFRLGDFYEMFFEDAILASKAMEITLTSRSKGEDGERIPMCGVPHHAAENYIVKLLEKGFKVAICNQVEDPRQAKGVVKREVTRVVTPGTVLNDQVLEARTPNFLLAVADGEKSYGIAFLDFTTGDFRVTEVESENMLLDEVSRIDPREILCRRGIGDAPWRRALGNGMKSFFLQNWMPLPLMRPSRKEGSPSIWAKSRRLCRGVVSPRDCARPVRY